MLRLILMRHAKSDWSHAGLSDHDRPLNARGRASAMALGDWLRENHYLPDEVLCSSAQRTGETLSGLDLGPETTTEFTKALYLAEPRVMLETLSTATRRCVLMIGHNPGICEMANGLVDEPPSHPRFADYPTGATLVCDFSAPRWSEVNWHTGQVVDFTIPRELTAT
ncbi:MAG: histidine phosphatase family protein [Pseudomonadota bacterium]